MSANLPTDVARRETVRGREPGADASSPGRPPAPAAADPSAIPPAVARTFSALERSGIPWALLRGEAELGSPGGDVDVLVAGEDLARLAGELAQLGFGRLRRPGHGPHTFFLAYDPVEDRWVKLDVVTALAYGRHQELTLEGAAGCLKRRRRSPDGLALLAEDDAFWTLFLHCLLDGGGFPAAHRRTLLRLASGATARGPVAQIVDRTLPDDLRADALLGQVKAEDWVSLERTATSIWARWSGRFRLALKARALRNRTRRRLGRIPPLCGPGLRVRARPAEFALIAAVAERWPLPHRKVRLEGSTPALLRTLALTRWHSLRGRLVLVACSQRLPLSRVLERVVGGCDFDALGLSMHASAQEATAEIWRRYLERSGT
jgi:hypothetical protein